MRLEVKGNLGFFQKTNNEAVFKKQKIPTKMRKEVN